MVIVLKELVGGRQRRLVRVWSPRTLTGGGSPLYPLTARGPGNETHMPAALAEGLHVW